MVVNALNKLPFPSVGLERLGLDSVLVSLGMLWFSQMEADDCRPLESYAEA